MNLARLKSGREKKWLIGNATYIISDLIFYLSMIKSVKEISCFIYFSIIRCQYLHRLVLEAKIHLYRG